MIAPLRSLHRWAFVAIALVVPALFAASWHAKQLRPQVPRLPWRVDAAAPLPVQARRIATNLPVRVAVTQNELTRPVLEVETFDPLAVADPLIYWTSEPKIADRTELPADSVLLGAVPAAGRKTFRLPPMATRGSILFYSGAHRRVVDAIPLTGLSR